MSRLDAEPLKESGATPQSSARHSRQLTPGPTLLVEGGGGGASMICFSAAANMAQGAMRRQVVGADWAGAARECRPAHR